MQIPDKIPGMDTEPPKIFFDGKEFKDLTKVQRVAVLNYICGIAHMYRIISDSDRKKIYDRSGKAIQELLKQ